jgi:DNA-binding CsgD family transcriptional regulator
MRLLTSIHLYEYLIFIFLLDESGVIKVLLEHREQDRVRLEENVLANVRKLVSPYLEKLRFPELGVHNRNIIEIIETRLEELTSPFLNRLTALHRLLSPREIDVAVLVREGKTSKEISELLTISVSGVDFHRKMIRKKLGLTH